MSNEQGESGGGGGGNVTNDEGTPFRSPLLNMLAGFLDNASETWVPSGRKTLALDDPRLSEGDRMRFLRDRMMDKVGSLSKPRVRAR